MSSFISVLLTHYFAGDKIEENEMDGACSVYRCGERREQGFGGGNLSERDQWGDPGVNGRILRWIYKKMDVRVWTGLGWLGIDRWRALVNAVMNARVQ
jgi:hypothetical protein